MTETSLDYSFKLFTLAIWSLLPWTNTLTIRKQTQRYGEQLVKRGHETIINWIRQLES